MAKECKYILYVWTYENGAKELYPYNTYFTLISLNSKAASKPWKRAKIVTGRPLKEDKRVKKEKKTFLFIFISFPLERVSGEEKNARLVRDINPLASLS